MVEHDSFIVNEFIEQLSLANENGENHVMKTHDHHTEGSDPVRPSSGLPHLTQPLLYLFPKIPTDPLPGRKLNR